MANEVKVTNERARLADSLKVALALQLVRIGEKPVSEQALMAAAQACAY